MFIVLINKKQFGFLTFCIKCERSVNGTKKLTAFMLLLAASVSGFAGCMADKQDVVTNSESLIVSETVPDNVVRSKSAEVGDLFEPAEEPFSSYTYDFAAYGSKYLITVTPDEKGTGLTLSVEDNSFGFSEFSVEPPAGYVVVMPYSQEYASEVCTVIRSSEENAEVPDLLKIDFYLAVFDDESLPYSVSRFYSILNGSLVEVEVYDTTGEYESEFAAATTFDAIPMVLNEEKAKSGTEYLSEMDYIPDSSLYRTEEFKFMPAPTVTQYDDGSLDVNVVTYTLNPHDMTMRRQKEDCSLETNPLYYGYSVYAEAGDIYKYFTMTSLNVTDYENYVEVKNGDSSLYFFKVDDPRFHTVQELRDYVSRWFSADIVEEMFRSAPQQYRDIDGELYTVLGDGGIDETLGRLTITDWQIEEVADDGVTGAKKIITYHTKQEKFNELHEMTGYVDGGDFVVETSGDGTDFLITKYRYSVL